MEKALIAAVRLPFFFFCFYLLTACGAGDDASVAKGVFGPDDRVAVSQNAAVFKRVGKIAGCTASLIQRRLILTAAHCVLDDNNKLRSGMTFCAGAHVAADGRNTCVASSGVAHAWWGDSRAGGRDTTSATDYAVVALTEPLGERFGWFGIRYRDDFGVGAQVINLSYPGDNGGGRTQLQQNCRIRGRSKSGMLLHDCDSWGGASGSPLYVKTSDDRRYIIGIHVGGDRQHFPAYSHANAGLGVSSDKFRVDFQAALAKFP